MTTKLHVDLKLGQTLTIGDAVIRLEKKSGQVARLVIEASAETTIKTPAPARKSALHDLEHAHGQHSV